jgi:sugar lactone lactonase YvrE
MNRVGTPHRLLVVGLLLVTHLSGCAPPRRPPPLVFFPEPPADARLVYLGRLNEVPIDPPAAATWRQRWLGEPTFLEVTLVRPSGLAAAGEQLFVCDSAAGAVFFFDFARRETRVIDRLSRPAAVALDESRVYIAEADAGRIAVFDRNLRRIGIIQPPDGRFRPVALALGSELLYVADIEHKQVRRYDTAAGRWLDPLTILSNSILPGGLAVHRDRLWVSDSLTGRLLWANPRYSDWRVAAPPGHLLRPRHLACDDAGRILIVDAARGALQIRDDEGAPLLDVRDDGALTLPIGVCLSGELLRFYRPRLPRDISATAIVFVSNQSDRPGVAVFAYAPP